MTDEDPRLRQLDQIYDADGRLKEPDAQVVLLRQSPDESVWVLMPTHAYVEAHTGRYRNYCGAALGLTFLGCLIHWLATKPDDLGGYVIATAFVALAAALTLKIWNSAMRAGIVVTVGRRIQVSITAVKLLVHPMLGERLGLSRSKDGRFWQLHHIGPKRTRLRFMVAYDAFPTLPQFLRDTVKELLTDLDAAPESGTPAS